MNTLSQCPTCGEWLLNGDPHEFFVDTDPDDHSIFQRLARVPCNSPDWTIKATSSGLKKHATNPFREKLAAEREEQRRFEVLAQHELRLRILEFRDSCNWFQRLVLGRKLNV